ncbi:MAG: hypothetical protein P4L83_01980 [Nevskia sp.]|nr:hypothetical protein [Nevskia sp.]
MKHRTFIQLLAILWLALGQCTLVIHATDHELEAKAKPCQLCATAHASAGPPAVIQLLAQRSFLPSPPPAGTRPAAPAFRFARPYHTGPPATHA